MFHNSCIGVIEIVRKILYCFIFVIVFQTCVTESRYTSSKLTNTTCEFKVLNFADKKLEFDIMKQSTNLYLIYFHINISPENYFLNTTGYDNKLWNGITRWIWVLDEHINFLTYPVDFNEITLHLASATDRTIKLDVNFTSGAGRLGGESYDSCTQTLYNEIVTNILDENQSNWRFCHRYFENQDWKIILFNITGAWLGYDFACFDTFHKTLNEVTHIKKGKVNIVVNIFVGIVLCYLPLLFLSLPNRIKINENQKEMYQKGDYPYSFSRFILRINEKHCTPDIDDKSFTIKKFFSQNFRQFTPEIHLFTLLIIFGMVILYINVNMSQNKFPDFKIYPDIYLRQPVPVIVDLTNIKEISLILIMYFTYLPLLIIFLVYESQSESLFVSIVPFGFFKVTDFLQESKEVNGRFIGYTNFARKFLDRIALFFHPDLWKLGFALQCKLKNKNNFYRYACRTVIGFVFLPFNICLYTICLLVPSIYLTVDFFIFMPLKLFYYLYKTCKTMRDISENSKSWVLYLQLVCVFIFALPGISILCVSIWYIFVPYLLQGTQFVIRLIIYLLFVAIPLFGSYEKSYTFWAITLSIALYILKFTVTYHRAYKKLLDKLLDIKKNNHTNIDNRTSENTFGIHVKTFDKIAAKYLPLRNELFKFFLKATLTSLFLYVTFDTLNSVGDDKLSQTFLPQIITVAMPSIAEKLCSPSDHKDVFDALETDLKFSMAEETDQKTECSIQNISEESMPETLETRTHPEDFKECVERCLRIRCPILCPLCTTCFDCGSFILEGLYQRPSNDIEAQSCPCNFAFCRICSNEQTSEILPLLENRIQ